MGTDAPALSVASSAKDAAVMSGEVLEADGAAGARVARVGVGRRVRSPLGVRTMTAMTCLGLCIPVTHSARIDETQLMDLIKHAEFAYEVPPCAQHCGKQPKCEQKGWFYSDMYVYWLDEEENFCRAIKSPVARGVLQAASDSYLGMAALSIFSALSDG